MTKVCDHILRGPETSRLHHLEATVQGLVQARQLGLAQVIVRIRQAEIDLPFGSPGGASPVMRPFSTRMRIAFILRSVA